MTKDIYGQHRAAFSNVSAFVVMKDNERIATVAIKYPRDGAGRLWAYVHCFGMPMQRHSSTGYGYDKRTPAVLGAFAKTPLADAERIEAWPQAAHINDLILIARDNMHGGRDWDAVLREAGFNVFQAV